MIPTKHRFTFAAILLIWTCLLTTRTNNAQAQDPRHDIPNTDSIATSILPNLALDLYNSSSIVDRNYDYELINKKRSLKMRAYEVSIIGAITFAGIALVNGKLAYENEWNLWIDIPCATLVGLSTMFPFILWSKNLFRKADAIEISPTFGYVGKTGSQTTTEPNPTVSSSLFFGVNVNANF